MVISQPQGPVCRHQGVLLQTYSLNLELFFNNLKNTDREAGRRAGHDTYGSQKITLQKSVLVPILHGFQRWNLGCRSYTANTFIHQGKQKVPTDCCVPTVALF